ncbi:MAG: phosphatase PAP2 family protein [Nitrospirota bacterium]
MFFKPVDILTFCFIAALGSIAILCAPSLQDAVKLILPYILSAFILFFLGYLRTKHRMQELLFYIHPGIYGAIILVIFNSLGNIIPLLWQRTFDDVLIRIDFFLFGVHPTVWLEQIISSWLTTLLQFAYICYYGIPLALGMFLLKKGKEQELNTALFGIVLCFYASYIGYLLVPALGPRFALEHLQTTDLDAIPVVQFIQDTLNGWEHNKMDAFPSGHTAIALVSCFYAWKLREKVLVWILIPVVILLLFSTVYLRYHYVIDVIAGIGLALFTILVSPSVSRFFSRLSKYFQR